MSNSRDGHYCEPQATAVETGWQVGSDRKQREAMNQGMGGLGQPGLLGRTTVSEPTRARRHVNDLQEIVVRLDRARQQSDNLLSRLRGNIPSEGNTLCDKVAQSPDDMPMLDAFEILSAEILRQAQELNVAADELNELL